MMTTEDTLTSDRKKIMVIEDDKEIRETIHYALEIDGYEVISKPNGKEALDLLQEIPVPGLILLDLSMPVMGGAEFIENLRTQERHRNVPVVVLTAARNKPRPREVADFLTKPIDLDMLLRIADQYCGPPAESADVHSS
jgi:CheY-like chemotaxis protein